MFHRNMKVSSMPMSAWNLIGDQIQVATPIASIAPVRPTAAPVLRSVLKYASCMLMLRRR